MSARIIGNCIAGAGRIRWPAGLNGATDRAMRVGLFSMTGASVGWAAWGHGEETWSLLCLLVLPLMWGVSRSRGEALALMLAYFLAGARGLPGGAVVFFGDEAPRWWGFGMWLAASMLLTIPFVLFWARYPGKRAVGFVMALLSCMVPPLGIVGWLSPLSVAGVLLPSTEWVGLVLAITLFAAMVLRWGGTIAGLAAVAVLFNTAALQTGPAADERWLGFDTSFPKLSSAGADQASQFLASMARIDWLRGVIADMPAGATLVLPETVLGRFDGVAQAMLIHAEEELVAKRSRVLVGAELVGDAGKYKNAVVVLGSQPGEDRAAVQGIPVPVSMWKPWAADGAQADLLARGNGITVGEYRVGVAICYEQLLAYSLMRLMWDKPDIVAAVSNVWWARDTNIPQIQFQSVHAFARLFGVPVVTARNL